VAGSRGWGDAGVFNRLRAGEPGVRYLGYVPESELPAITSAATAFAYPSLYEGFGLPVAQALAAGVPVVTSNVSSLPEIAGDAALLIDPRSPSEIASALDRLLTSASLRSTLSAKGRKRAERSRWELAARQSWEFFQAVRG
jgi:alpha-1,3-rhamnosyl/mannosyltransferase